MSGFHSIIRPFETPSVAPPRRTATSQGSSSGGPLQIVVGGTATAGAELAVTVTSTAIAGSPVTVTYALSGGDSLTTAVQNFVAAFNNTAALLAAGIVATIVSGRPLEITITQPASLDPQATFAASTTLTLTVQLSQGNIQLRFGERGTGKTMNGSYSLHNSVYVHKIPQEMQAFAVPATLREAIRFKLPPFFTGFSPP